MKLARKIEKYQTVEKFSLITSASILIPAGVTLCSDGNPPIGITFVILGVLCLLGRELLKLKK
ncbi:MAG: hypothetical protein U9P50_01760 [Patescibacteria group bacterium]|nr:hypothetical protein [Patescibacteria group bacterium]